MSRWKIPITSTAKPDRVAISYGQGYWLMLTQIVLGILALLTLLVFFGSLPVYFMQLQTVCQTISCAPGQLTLTAVQTLHSLGISVDDYALFRIINIIISTLAGFVVAGVLVWRRSYEWMALLVAFMLIMMGVTASTNTVADSASVWHLSAQVVSLLTYPTYFLVFMVFPNGHFVPRWTRWLLIAVVALAFCYTFFPTSFTGNFWFFLSGTLLFVSLAGSLPAIQIYRYWWVSTPVERQQTKWVIFALALEFALVFGPYVLTLVIPPLHQPSSLYAVFFNPDAGGTPLNLLFPLSLGVAILRYRLWDIDIVINRTLVYAILTALLALIYFGLVISLQFLLHGIINQHSSIASIASTVVIAALFQPLRHRIQNVIDRHFYRRKYNAAHTLEAFSATLRDEVDLGQLNSRLIAVVQETMQPTDVSLWLRPPEHEGR